MAATAMAARAYCTLRFRPLWPRHFQSDGIITGAAMRIPPSGGGNTGVPGCQWRNEMQGGDEPERGRDGGGLQNA